MANESLRLVAAEGVAMLTTIFSLLQFMLLVMLVSDVNAATPVPKISVTPSSVDFGSVKAGGASPLKTVTVKNSGTSPLSIGSITISGANGSEFTQTNSCNLLQPGGGCTVTVAFSPLVQYGSKSAAMAISSNDPKKPLVTVKLAGITPPPVISLTPSSLSFGKMAAGDPAGTKTVTIKNSGLSDLVVSAVSVSGADSGLFAADNSCSPIPKGGACTINVTFTPQLPAGKKAGLLQIFSNDAKKPTFSLKMTGETGPAKPGAPSDLTASSGSSTGIDLAWLDNSGDETGFKIERKTGLAGTYAVVGSTGANDVTYHDSGLKPATTYFYRVRAVNSAGYSGYSNEAAAVTSSVGGSNGVVQLPRTGQAVSYAPGDDGALQKGVPWPAVRFTDNGNGTVSDNLTGLVWLKNADCFGVKTWDSALIAAATLSSGACGLNDGSVAGQWRLPNRKELQSLVDYGRTYPALPAGHPFTNVRTDFYWSSTSSVVATGHAWGVYLFYGYTDYDHKSYSTYVLPVR